MLQKIRPRILCALESAAFHNPSREIYLVLDHQTQLSFLPKYLFDAYTNVRFRWINFGSLVNETPVEKLWDSGRVFRSKYYLNNISNVIR